MKIYDVYTSLNEPDAIPGAVYCRILANTESGAIGIVRTRVWKNKFNRKLNSCLPNRYLKSNDVPDYTCAVDVTTPELLKQAVLNKL